MGDDVLYDLTIKYNDSTICIDCLTSIEYINIINNLKKGNSFPILKGYKVYFISENMIINGIFIIDIKQGAKEC